MVIILKQIEIMNKGFIEQTAHDYDMEIEEVERIYRLFPTKFYEKLEEYISERSNSSY